MNRKLVLGPLIFLLLPVLFSFGTATVQVPNSSAFVQPANGSIPCSIPPYYNLCPPFPSDKSTAHFGTFAYSDTYNDVTGEKNQQIGGPLENHASNSLIFTFGGSNLGDGSVFLYALATTVRPSLPDVHNDLSIHVGLTTHGDRTHFAPHVFETTEAEWWNSLTAGGTCPKNPKDPTNLSRCIDLNFYFSVNLNATSTNPYQAESHVVNTISFDVGKPCKTSGICYTRLDVLIDEAHCYPGDTCPYYAASACTPCTFHPPFAVHSGKNVFFRSQDVLNAEVGGSNNQAVDAEAHADIDPSLNVTSNDPNVVIGPWASESFPDGCGKTNIVSVCSMTLETNKAQYSGNTTIKASGTINPAPLVDSPTLSLSVLFPNGTQLLQTPCNGSINKTGGDYSCKISTNSIAWAVSGKYTLKAEFTSDEFVKLADSNTTFSYNP